MDYLHLIYVYYCVFAVKIEREKRTIVLDAEYEVCLHVCLIYSLSLLDTSKNELPFIFQWLSWPG